MTKKAAWTVMVYLAGENNLTTERMFGLLRTHRYETRSKAEPQATAVLNIGRARRETAIEAEALSNPGETFYHRGRRCVTR